MPLIEALCLLRVITGRPPSSPRSSGLEVIPVRRSRIIKIATVLICCWLQHS